MTDKPCTGGCGTMIHFDANDKIKYGKWRPLESDNEPHHCPGPVGQDVYASRQQQMDVPTQQPQPYNQQQPQQQPQQQQQLGVPRVQVVQLEKGTWDRLREQIVGINRLMSQVTVDIDDIKQDIAFIKASIAVPKRNEERTSEDIYGRADDAEF